jgi:uncharacterized Zn-finger protein
MDVGPRSDESEFKLPSQTPHVKKRIAKLNNKSLMIPNLNGPIKERPQVLLSQQSSLNYKMARSTARIP